MYLARGEAGELAAVKVIQPEFAQQAEFRARFRREADSARGVDSPWVAPVLGADTEGPAPWLATAFVPGPSPAEAVAECGPLPARVVRVLGKVLARVLDAVHRAGLVHRDVTFEPVMRADFLTAARQAAEGWVFGAPYTEPQSARTTAAKAFTAAYRARYGASPGRWSAEAYDAVGLIARALDALGTTTFLGIYDQVLAARP